MTLTRKDWYSEDETNAVYDVLCGIDSVQIMALFTNYYGMSQLGSGFIDYLGDEGVIELVDEEEGNEN